MRIPGTRNTYPVLLLANFRSHWGEAPWTADGFYGPDTHETLRGKPKYRGVQHDEAPRPHEWRWWKLFALNYCHLDVRKPSSGRRLWVYTRWGSVHFDIFVDRRSR